MAANISDRATVWSFENRIGAIGAQALLDRLNVQWLSRGNFSRDGQISGATLIPAPKLQSAAMNRLRNEGTMPADW